MLAKILNVCYNIILNVFIGMTEIKLKVYKTDFNTVGTLFYLSKLANRSKGQLEGSLFNSYFTEVQERALLVSQDCSTLPLIRTLLC